MSDGPDDHAGLETTAKTQGQSRTVQGAKRDDKKSKIDAAAKEEETLGNDSSLAHQSFIRTRFKQSKFMLRFKAFYCYIQLLPSFFSTWHPN